MTPQPPYLPWLSKRWAILFTNFNAATGAVLPTPSGSFFFDPARSFYPNPTMTQWTQIVPVDPRGHGILQGSCWASRSCADFMAFVLEGTVVDGRLNFMGGVQYNQPQYLVRIKNPLYDEQANPNVSPTIDINPGEVASRFLGDPNAIGPDGNPQFKPAGPTGQSAIYLDWWLTGLTSGNF